MKLRIHYLNKDGEVAYQDAEFEQPGDGGPSSTDCMDPGDYEDQVARSFGKIGFKGEDEETKRVFWISPQWIIEVERLPDTGLEVE